MNTSWSEVWLFPEPRDRSQLKLSFQLERFCLVLFPDCFGIRCGQLGGEQGLLGPWNYFWDLRNDSSVVGSAVKGNFAQSRKCREQESGVGSVVEGSWLEIKGFFKGFL